MLPDQEEAGILCAVLVGDRSLLTEDTVQNFRRAGLSHLLVVSGMHLCLAAALAKALFSRFSERKRCLSVCLFVWCCAVLTGFGVSVVRAAIMVTSAESAVLFRRRGDTPTALSLAGILIVLVSPGAVTSASFLLSFSSVLGIALFSDRIGNALVSLFHPGKRLRRALFSSLAVSAAAQFGTLPVLAVCFGTVPALGLFANLFAVPLLAPILLFGALGILLFPLRAVFGLLCGVMLRILCAIASLFSLVPFSQFGISERWQLVWIAFAFLLCARCARSASQHRRRVSFLSGTLLLLVCTLFSFDAAQSAVTVTVFPQENMALLSRGTRAVLLGVPADSYAAKKVISAMQRQNLFTLESIICAEQTLPSALFTVTEQFSPAGIAAPDTPANRALCHAAGLRLCETDHLLALGSFPGSLEEPGLLAVIDPDGERLCPSDGICVIIEETFCTPYPLPDAVRIRRPIRRTP